MQPIRIASLFLISCSETYASAFSAGITETERLSSLPTLNCTVPSTKAKKSVVFSHTDVITRVEFSTSLTNDDVTCFASFATKYLNA